MEDSGWSSLLDVDNVVLGFANPSRRWPRQALEHDLTMLLAVVVALLNLGTVALLVSLDGWREILRELPFVLIGDAAMALMLRRARSSIAAGWADQTVALLSGRPKGSS